MGLYSIAVAVLMAGVSAFWIGFLVSIIVWPNAHYGNDTPVAIGGTAAVACATLSALLAMAASGWWFCWPVAALLGWIAWIMGQSIPDEIHSYRMRRVDR